MVHKFAEVLRLLANSELEAAGCAENPAEAAAMVLATHILQETRSILRATGSASSK